METPAGPGKIQLVTTLRQGALKGLISKESPVGSAETDPETGSQVDMGGGRSYVAEDSLHRKGNRRRLHPHRQL